MFEFVIQDTDGAARAGSLRTPHGILQTPLFAPVGTQATVKALTPRQLDEIGASLILANTYHLFLRPGDQRIAQLGGLHHFMAWDKPILTDSGGFQVFSLSGIKQLDEDGVTFKSHIDGSIQRLTPEISVAVQENLGADIIMAFDECAPPHDREYNQQAVQRTHAWLERCIKAKTRSDQALFGIVQGGIFDDLRTRSARYNSSLDLPGYAIGGLSVGESKEDMLHSIEVVNMILPDQKPRYLMGVGTPYDIVQGVARGIDIFDCVLPTRLARHSTALRLKDRLNLVNASFAKDATPIDEDCDCYTCQHFSRAYLRHLILAKEMLAATLLSIHNVYTLIKLTKHIRQSILNHTFHSILEEYSNL